MNATRRPRFRSRITVLVVAAFALTATTPLSVRGQPEVKVDVDVAAVMKEFREWVKAIVDGWRQSRDERIRQNIPNLISGLANLAGEKEAFAVMLEHAGQQETGASARGQDEMLLRVLDHILRSTEDIVKLAANLNPALAQKKLDVAVRVRRETMLKEQAVRMHGVASRLWPERATSIRRRSGQVRNSFEMKQKCFASWPTSSPGL